MNPQSKITILVRDSKFDNFEMKKEPFFGRHYFTCYISHLKHRNRSFMRKNEDIINFEEIFEGICRKFNF